MQQLLSEDNKVYIMVVPDKNYYVKDDNFLQIEYNYIYDKIDKLNLMNIELRNVLTLDDYYETDTHWKQENLNKVVYEMSKVMEFKYHDTYYKKNQYNGFYGVYYGESAIRREPENLIYLTNDIINNVNVNYLENKELNTVYNNEKLYSQDPYEVYLDGASSFIEIINLNSSSNKELVIFRDSFGSSITPLLIEYYSKITLIDNRYINSYNFLNYVNFTNQDVLFLYSTLLINESNVLKG